MGGLMKRFLLIALATMFIGCASIPVVKEDICDQISQNIKTEITVLHSEKDWEIYFVGVGGKLAYNMKVGSNDCVEVNVLHAPTNQELKGFYCMEKKPEGWYTVETMCEFTQGEVTARSIGVARKLTR